MSPPVADGATSDHPGVQAQLDRLNALGMRNDDFDLRAITELCARLGDPHRSLPPVFHVAGTNGKGSTIAFLRAAIEGAGGSVHAYTSPHLVRFNERIRVAGSLIEDNALEALLVEVLDAADGMKISFFEATTALAFLAFARTPATATLLEVGLGGRLDATNICRPVVTGIAQLGLDHVHVLGNTLAAIAGEKAGIAKTGVPLVTMAYPDDAMATIEARAAEKAVPIVRKGRDWDVFSSEKGVTYRDANGTLQLPHPSLGGLHQIDNLGLATAILRHQQTVSVYDLSQGATRASWPARMQKLAEGPLTRGIDATFILDGGHNPQAAHVLAQSLEGPVVMLAGILANRDAAEMLAAFQGRVTRFLALPIPYHDAHAPAHLANLARETLGVEATPYESVEEAFDALRAAPPPSGTRVLVMGSLYLAGEVLRLNREFPA